MTFWAYMIHCRAGKFYTGHTDDLERRMVQHESGLVPGYTQARHPLELVWSQEFQTRYEALEVEARIRGWSRKKKLALIRGDWGEISRLAKEKNGPSTSSGRRGLLANETVLNILRAEATLAAPNEACGLLFGTPDRIETALPTRNVHPTPRTHFEIDPAALIAAYKAARGGGAGIAGYWHSHPSGSNSPSLTDQLHASGDGKIWAIVAGGAVSFWRDSPGGFEPLSSRVVAG